MSDKRVGQKIKLLSVDELLGVPNSEGCVDNMVRSVLGSSMTKRRNLPKGDD